MERGSVALLSLLLIFSRPTNLKIVEEAVMNQQPVMISGKEHNPAEFAPDVAISLYTGPRIKFSELSIAVRTQVFS